MDAMCNYSLIVLRMRRFQIAAYMATQSGNFDQQIFTIQRTNVCVNFCTNIKST
jgi:hypothetical protein